MKLIDSLEEIRKHNSAIAVTLDLPSVESFINQATNDHLIGAIGIEQYQHLVSGKPGFSEGSKEYSVIQLLQASAVGFMLAYYSNTGSVQISSSGIHVIKGNNTLPASDSKIRALRKQSFGDGFRALEYAISCLEYYSEVFDIYHHSSARDQNLSRFLNSSQDFTAAGVMVSPHLFQSLKMYIENCESDIIEPILGEELFSALKVKIKASTASEKEKMLIAKVSEIISRISMAEAIPYIPMSIHSSGGFDLKDDQDSIQINAADNRLAGAMIRLRDNAESKLESLRKWLSKNHSDFPQYNVPGEVKMNDDPNSNIYIL